MTWQSHNPEARASIVAAVCDDIADGMSLRAACGDRISKRNFLRWLEEDTKEAVVYRHRYVRARELQADHIADETIEIADTDPDPHRARVRFDARKWAASKLAPKKYGDKLETTNTTTLDVSDPIAALIMRVAESGKKVHDDSDR